MDAPEIGPAALAPRDSVLELTHAVRGALVARGEFVPAGWVEEGAEDLSSGRLTGWVARRGPAAVGLAFYRSRTGHAYGHVHVGESAEDDALARALVDRVRLGLPHGTRRLDLGVTGLSPSAEARLESGLSSVHGASTMVRHGLERPVGSDESDPPQRPPRTTMHPVRSLPAAALAELDLRGFRGTADEGLVAETPPDAQRFISGLLDHQAGRFLDEASTALVDERGALVGMILTAEQSPRRAVFLDLVVEPAARRTGLGELLLRWGLRALWALGYHVATLWVSEANTPALALYERLGFKRTQTARIYRFDLAADSARQPHSGS